MKMPILLLLASAVLVISSCSDYQFGNDISTVNDEVSIKSMVSHLYYSNPSASYEEVQQYVYEQLGVSSGTIIRTKSPEGPSEVALYVLQSITLCDPGLFESKENYFEYITGIVDCHRNNLATEEFDAFNTALTISDCLVDLKYGVDTTKSFKEGWRKWGRCVAGIVGGAGSGALGGAAVATVPTLGIGAVAGAIIGGISGGLVGASAACDGHEPEDEGYYGELPDWLVNLDSIQL